MDREIAEVSCLELRIADFGRAAVLDQVGDRNIRTSFVYLAPLNAWRLGGGGSHPPATPDAALALTGGFSGSNFQRPAEA